MSFRLVIVTGASRGFGKSLCLSFSENFKQPLHFVLNGRNSNELSQTKAEIEKSRENLGFPTIIDIVPSDLSDINTLEQTSEALFGNSVLHSNSYSDILLINNAGSLGPLNLLGYHGSSKSYLNNLSMTINLNITSCLFLSSELIKRSKDQSFPKSIREVLIVNVSSLAAIKPFESWSIYCSGKAARDMFHNCIALESHLEDQHTQTPAIKSLNYAPGPLDTDMQKEIRETPNTHKETQQLFINMEKEHKLIQPIDSANKLTHLLLAGNFENGSHVDFFDL